MIKKATLGGGCFWCLDALYKQVRGIIHVDAGYAGGRTKHPTYELMHYEQTGHAEVVQLTFDSSVISYEEILQIFYSIHDPTTPNRQGNDVGPEYRSIILYHDEGQKEVANRVTESFAKDHWSDPIVTEIIPLAKFYKAEDYHQDFYAQNPTNGYCQVIINPKLAKFRKSFAKWLVN